MRESNSKKAILIVSFGTSHKDTREKTIDAIEIDCKGAFPGIPQRRAFTSSIIMKKLKSRNNLHIDNVTEAMEKLIYEGYRRVVIQPTHILNGDEYEKMVAMAKAFEGKLDSLEIGAPLLTTSDDFNELCRGVAEHLSAHRNDDNAVVLMGHGTGHHTDAVYAALEYRFHALGYKNIFVGTVEGYPDFDTLLERIKEYGPTKCVLFPLMIVAGEHAKNDMAGEEDSWKKKLEQSGYKVECLLEGLGELDSVRAMYVEHLRRAVEGEESQKDSL